MPSTEEKEFNKISFYTEYKLPIEAIIQIGGLSFPDLINAEMKSISNLVNSYVGNVKNNEPELDSQKHATLFEDDSQAGQIYLQAMDHTIEHMVNYSLNPYDKKETYTLTRNTCISGMLGDPDPELVNMFRTYYPKDQILLFVNPIQGNEYNL